MVWLKKEKRDKMAHASFMLIVAGMKTEEDTQKVEQALKLVSGVSGVAVDLETRIVSLGANQLVQHAQLVSAISRIGFTVVS